MPLFIVYEIHVVDSCNVRLTSDTKLSIHINDYYMINAEYLSRFVSFYTILKNHSLSLTKISMISRLIDSFFQMRLDLISSYLFH